LLTAQQANLVGEATPLFYGGFMTLHMTQQPDGSSGWFDGNGNLLFLPNYTESGTTAASMKRYGLATLASTGAKTITIDAPVIGCYKEIVKTANSTAIITVSVGTGVTVGGSTTVVTKILFNGLNDSCILRGVSATKWYVVANNSVTLST
jgi:hypothetical protein